MRVNVDNPGYVRNVEVSASLCHIRRPRVGLSLPVSLLGDDYSRRFPDKTVRNPDESPMVFGFLSRTVINSVHHRLCRNVMVYQKVTEDRPRAHEREEEGAVLTDVHTVDHESGVEHCVQPSV